LQGSAAKLGREDRKGKRMRIEEFNAWCASLPRATHVVQWGGAQVWKVGGKVFALARADPFRASFKVTPMGFEVLSDAPGCIPAPYLASRGIKWIQVTGPETLDDDALRTHLAQSYAMVVAKLTKKLRAELGL
jgi:predicted DNA-binding protein (MmcQ/YjbR family)